MTGSSWPVEFEPEARRQLREARDWWQTNRESGALVIVEVRRAVGLLRRFPEVGVIFRRRRGLEIRRFLIPQIEYHLYTVFNGRRVSVVSMWHAHRKRGPRLR